MQVVKLEYRSLDFSQLKLKRGETRARDAEPRPKHIREHLRLNRLRRQSANARRTKFQSPLLFSDHGESSVCVFTCVLSIP